VEERILQACEIDRLHRARILVDGHAVECLAAYRRAIWAASDAMAKLGVRAACARCGSVIPGGCCFEGMEQHIDTYALWANLLLGVRLPERAMLRGCCFFIGDHGCRLLACGAFCLNYLCDPLKAALGPDGVTHLLALVGDQISAGWEMERRLRQLVVPPADRGS